MNIAIPWDDGVLLEPIHAAHQLQVRPNGCSGVMVGRKEEIRLPEKLGYYGRKC